MNYVLPSMKQIHSILLPMKKSITGDGEATKRQFLKFRQFIINFLTQMLHLNVSFQLDIQRIDRTLFYLI